MTLNQTMSMRKRINKEWLRVWEAHKSANDTDKRLFNEILASLEKIEVNLSIHVDTLLVK
jgi:hypothetical protein